MLELNQDNLESLEHLEIQANLALVVLEDKGVLQDQK